MDTERTRLIEKFVKTRHLSVPEREIVGAIDAKEIIDIVTRIVQSEGKYPAHFDPEKGFHGTVLYREGGKYIVRTKVESGVVQFGEIERRIYESLTDAVTYTVSKIFSTQLDGVPVRW
ncbi:MAG TPA: hypothetical protein VKS81_02565 [Bacteroidota bacterium]|nr:hypothetical protein [Bacteroidota bacterium]